MRIFKMFISLVTMFVMVSSNTFSQGKGVYINIKERGAKGDGFFDNWEIIQRAVDEAINNGGGTVFLPAGEYAIYGKSIAIWGSNVKLIGEGAARTTIIKKGAVGYFGECIDICGKIDGYQYYGEFGGGDYRIIRFYRGETIQSKNIILENLKISSDLAKGIKNRQVANNIGIINSDNVRVKNCIVENAPQTNVAIVNDTDLFLNGSIAFENCVFKSSEQHNVRVISYNRGSKQGNKVSFKRCEFLTMKGKRNIQKEISEYDVHLWYRGTVISNNSSLDVENCFFDETGVIFLNSNTNGFTIQDSEVQASLDIVNSGTFEMSPRIKIINSKFSLKGAAQKSLTNGLKLNKSRALSKGYKKVTFGTIYPGNLKVLD